jgi:phospholipase/carboxylesterase
MPETSLLPCVELEPRGGADASVLWLHGLGADGHDFEPLAPMLGTERVRYVFPHAPALPVTINGGVVMPAWYDIRTLDFEATGREDFEHVEASARRIEALLDRERERGIPSDRIVLAGFSQGAAMAMHVGLRQPEALAGLLVLSGYLVAPERLAAEQTEAARSVPVLSCHGRHDPLVPLVAGKMSFERLSALAAPGTALEWRDYAMGHEVCPDEIAAIGAWLRARLN